MDVPIDVTFRGMPVSKAVEDLCLDEVAKLERYHDHLIDCHIVISKPHRRHIAGNLYCIDINLGLPGQRLVVNRVPAEHRSNEDPYLAVREAFVTARRRLEDRIRRSRQKVKFHEVAPHGKVTEIYPEDGYGFLETADGFEVYFHGNSLLDTELAAVHVGTPVRFQLEEGLDGLQASSVRVVGRHHHLRP